MITLHALAITAAESSDNEGLGAIVLVGIVALVIAWILGPSGRD